MRVMSIRTAPPPGRQSVAAGCAMQFAARRFIIAMALKTSGRFSAKLPSPQPLLVPGSNAAQQAQRSLTTVLKPPVPLQLPRKHPGGGWRRKSPADSTSTTPPAAAQQCSRASTALMFNQQCPSTTFAPAPPAAACSGTMLHYTSRSRVTTTGNGDRDGPTPVSPDIVDRSIPEVGVPPDR